MNKDSFVPTPYNAPFIPNRADPYILHADGGYYFTASVPEYDRIILRRADTLEGLRSAQERVLWHRHESGIMSRNIWAPELHRIGGKWVIFFAAGEQDDMWKIRPWLLVCQGDNPMQDDWMQAGQVKPMDEFTFQDFSLDMTSFEAGGRRYCVWAEKVSTGKKISNLYIAALSASLEMTTPQMLLSSPSYPWERHGFWVEEGPAVIRRDGKLFLTFSASDTGPAYCIGMLWAHEDDDLMDISVWHKVNHPVLTTDAEKGLYGPGHNSFFTDEAGEIYMAYHARQYDEIIGDPLYDPNRHCYIMKVSWKDGMPVLDYENQLFQK